MLRHWLIHCLACAFVHRVSFLSEPCMVINPTQHPDKMLFSPPPQFPSSVYHFSYFFIQPFATPNPPTPCPLSPFLLISLHPCSPSLSIHSSLLPYFFAIVISQTFQSFSSSLISHLKHLSVLAFALPPPLFPLPSPISHPSFSHILTSYFSPFPHSSFFSPLLSWLT